MYYLQNKSLARCLSQNDGSIIASYHPLKWYTNLHGNFHYNPVHCVCSAGNNYSSALHYNCSLSYYVKSGNHYVESAGHNVSSANHYVRSASHNVRFGNRYVGSCIHYDVSGLHNAVSAHRIDIATNYFTYSGCDNTCFSNSLGSFKIN